jgi:hypothetical protein
MTFVPVVNMDYPNYNQLGNSNDGQSSGIDATGEMYAWIGSVWWPDRSVTSRDIRRARFQFGAVVKAGGSGLTFSLQNLDLTNGPPGRPDGTQDQTAAIANGNAAFVTSGYITTADLSADRTVNFGDRFAAVIEYDGAGRLGSDSFEIRHITTANTGDGPATFLGGAWARTDAANGIVFEFADGTSGLLLPSGPWASGTIASASLNTGTTPDEVAMQFTPDFKCKIDGAWVGVNLSSGANFDIVLYEGTTALRTVSFDGNTLKQTGYQVILAEFAEIELTPSTTYYVALKPTTATNTNFRALTAASAAIAEMWLGGDTVSFASRTDAGAWTETDTRRMFAGVRISAIDDGSGGGGGGSGVIGKGLISTPLIRV